MSKPVQPIFYDPHGRRWRRVRRTWLALAVTVTALAAILVVSVLANPFLPRLNLRPIAALPHTQDVQPLPPQPPATTPREQKAKRAATDLKSALKTTPVVPAKHRTELPVVPPASDAQLPKPSDGESTAKPLAIGFYVNWDDSSYSSLKRNLNQLDWVVPEWVRLRDMNDGGPLALDIDAVALNYIRQNRPQTPILPLVQNYKDEQWNPGLLARAVADESARQRLISALSQLVEENKFAGVCIDFEEVPTASQANLLRFMQELHAAFQARGWIVAQAVPFDNSDWNYRAYAAATDYLMLMAYDEHWSVSEAGAVAGEDWYERTLARRMRELQPSKTIICIGGYGYDWTQGKGEAAEVTFQEAVLSARDSEADIKFDTVKRNPYFQYEEEDGSFHTVWFLDAVTAFNEMRAADGYSPAGYALWRLGSEDPSLWSVFGSAHTSSSSTDGLRDIKYGYDVDFEGTGEILQVAALPHDGERNFKRDAATGFITSEEYTATPSSYVIQRTGDHPGLIALTFDDGPDAVWTPRILDILKQENVPATFFIIGENGQANPALVRRIVSEGHDIGNHTYTHPNMGEIPGRVSDLELNATQRLIESLTNRSTRLFRPPYFGDAEPQTPEEVEPAVRAEKLGYITVGLRIDPDDWKLRDDNGNLRTSDDIVNETIKGALEKDPDARGEIVLLHDGGGDRSRTIAALPRIIKELRARGYRFVTVSELAGLTRDQAMPPVPPERGFAARANEVTFYTLSTAGWLMGWIFLVGIVLGLARLAFIGALAFAQKIRSRRRERECAGKDYQPFVSIIVPAYNEERVIARTIESLLASSYTQFEIIVVDDGSPDRTSEVVRERFEDERRVRLFKKANGGKAEALNYGLRYATGEVIITLDADTIFMPGTVAALARRFYDPRTGAVSGNTKVGNRINVITRWQALEYITSQNLDRRAFASLNGITVVSGAVGAWRRDAIERAGGFSSDTLAEDQDLTIRVRRLGYKIGYEETAIGWTEAPDTIRTLARQRFRWSYGTLQCMWKHINAILRPRYGALSFVSMPNVWIFQILFPLISPVMDLMLMWSGVSALLERLEHPSEYAITNLNQVLFYYALFLAVDWLAAAFAFLLEKRERWRLLWWLLLQRFCYRQVMYYVMIKSVVSAARGALVGWGKLERKGSVEVQTESA